MPNGGPTPDCIHCKFFIGETAKEDSWRCANHNIHLAYPIRAFCAAFEDATSYEWEWLEQEFEPKTLDSEMMYLWLEFYNHPHKKHFAYVPLTSIQEYATWSSEKFLGQLGDLVDKHGKDE